MNITGSQTDHRCPWTFLAYPGQDEEVLVRCSMWRDHADSVMNPRHSSLSGFEWSQNDHLAHNPEHGERDADGWAERVAAVA